MSDLDAPNGSDPAGDDVWTATTPLGIDPDCSPTKVCRNARDFTFDGIAEGEEDLQTAWRKLLEREGKSSSEAESIRDLILGPSAGD